MMPSTLRLLAPLAAVLLLSPPGSTQQGQPPRDSREAMWPSPTAEDWAKPCMITWQRNWEDALAVSAETGRPILVCVNMDGEIASEHYAGIRYRQPEIAALYEPYVTVIASVYRHTPRDFDEEGRRVPCPRFGTVTCGEHITIEPILYEKYFEGKRIAPRHIMIELDGEETYDVYYAFDTDSVFKQIHDGMADRADTPPPIVRGDRPILERVGSRDVRDRVAVEEAYRNGDAQLRRALLEAAQQHSDAAPLDLLRMAIYGFDAELGQLARQALSQTNATDAVDLVAEALRVPMETGERDALIAALDRLGDKSSRARTLSVVHRGLATRSTVVDVEQWTNSMSGSEYPAPKEWNVVEADLEQVEQRTVTNPEDAQARLELAEASLRYAADPSTAQMLASEGARASRFARLMFEDARQTALDAEKMGATGWRVDAAVALSSYYLAELDEAYARSAKAVEQMPPGETGWNAVATLAIFAEARRKAISDAIAAKQEWPSQWLTDVHSAYSVVAQHPLCTESVIVSHYDFLKSLGAKGQADRVLDQGLARYPDSWQLHGRFRGRVLEDKGLAKLESVYEAMLQREDAPANLSWYAGYASLITAEFHRRKSNGAEALAAYDRAMAHYEASIEKNPETRDSSDHYVALVLAARARLALESKDYDQALKELLASFARKPEAAASHDGMGLSPVATAKMLGAQLRQQGLGEQAASLQAALDALDPALLELPAFEREIPDGLRPDERPSWRRPRRSNR